MEQRTIKRDGDGSYTKILERRGHVVALRRNNVQYVACKKQKRLSQWLAFGNQGEL